MYSMYLCLIFNICKDVTCSPDPPEIPTSPEYSLAGDDGKVFIESVEYPSHPQYNRREYFLNSTWSKDHIPKNYMANLR